MQAVCLLRIFLHALDVLLHSIGAVPLHLVSHMAVNIRRERRCGVTEIALDCLDIVPASYRGHGIRMPLWHNKDKSKNPCVASEYPQRGTM